MSAATTTTSTGSSSGSGRLKLTVSGATSGAFDGSVAFNGCGVVGGGNGYHLDGTATIKGHTIGFRLEMSPYHGAAAYPFNVGGVLGHFEDQTARLRWADGPGASGTVTTTSATAGSLDITLVSTPFKVDDPVPPASTERVIAGWSCG